MARAVRIARLVFGSAGCVRYLARPGGSSAGAHAGQVGRDGVGGVTVEVSPGHVVAHGGARVGVAHGVLHVADADAWIPLGMQ
jgi:hypothetical protein